ncbi:DNA repair protein crb2 [Mycena sanguinolenta]|uniref:DNA repair protein crb2 n=1 Tax=Mycena sanguinolenta TaxID=230812 RepID=A0A8H6YRH0_9AGAR|nr:DNA repair protein crb2 [Mycena sanguinolenta]
MDVDERDGGAEGESQASQMLRNALDSQSDDEMAIHNTNTVPVDELDISKDLSSTDSIRSSRTMPHYHFHGLATTQTQSQQYDDEGTPHDAGSQKENVNATREALSSSSDNQIAPCAILVQSPQKLAKMPRVDKPSKDKPPKPTNLKAVSFESPIKAVETATKLPDSRPSARSLRRATPARKRDASQDSFAGDFEDPAQKFIASTKQFNIPLAELRRAPSPSIEESKPFMENEGTILVDDTPAPSVAGSSHSQSQALSQENYEHLQNVPQPEPDYDDIEMHMPIAEASDSSQSAPYESSEPTSSYRAMYDNPGPAYEPTQPAYEPTQPAYEPTQLVEPNEILEPTEIEPTQLLTPARERARMELQNMSDPPLMRTEGFSITTNTTGGPRSLFDSMSPNKRERYAHIAQASRANNSTVHHTAAFSTAATARLGLQDTQPAFEPAQSTPPRSVAKPRSAARRALVDERTEIVPDSEPPRESTPSPPPPPQPPARNAAKRRQRSARSSDTESDSEAVLDSTANVNKENKAELSILMRQEEEEDEEEEECDDADDEEDDMPLKLKGKDVKGKGKAVEMGAPPPVKVKTAKAAPNPLKGRKPRASSPKMVPSSVPHQDLPPEDVVPVKSKAKATRTKPTAPRGGKTPAAGTSGRARNKVNYKEESTEDEPESQREEEVTTADEEEYVTGGPSTRKRKRGIKEETPNAQSKPRKGRKATRQVKRARAGSAGSSIAGEATRVFALWSRDRHYYPGVVHALASGQDRFIVYFDDETKQEVRLDQMRLCLPRVGDSVSITNPEKPTVDITVDITGVDLDAGTVTVESKNFQDTILISYIRIPGRTIIAEWKDRLVTSVVCQVKSQSSFISPAARVSVTRSFQSKLFSQVGFCITHTEKQAKTALIKSNGGMVFDDWECMLGLEGQKSGERWILQPSDAAPTELMLSLQRVFLLAEDFSQTPKYLLALAFGIPCLRMNFIEHAIKTGRMSDWTNYLLPAGFLEHNSARMSQFINLDWGKDRRKDLENIMTDTTAYKAFEGKTILCVSPRVLDESDVSAALPRVMLAMGALSVEAVQKIENATLTLTDYSYIVTKDAMIKPFLLRGCIVVSWDWVKEVLISRRMLTPY